MFLKKEEKKYNRLVPILRKPQSSIISYLHPDFIKALPYISHIKKSLYSVLGDYFQSSDLRLAFTFQAKYLGMSPLTCPGFYSIIPYIEHKQGIFHVMGGLNKISEAMAKSIKEDNGKINLGKSVKRLIIKNKKVEGVVLENGERRFADKVIINADFSYAMENLFPKGFLKKYSPQKLKKKKYSCSAYLLYLGINRKINLPHHTICFGDNYKKFLHDIENHKLTDEIAMYIQNATVTDKSLAPKGKTALYVLVPTTNNRAKIDWKKQNEFKEKIFSKLEKVTKINNLRKHIEFEKTITPDEWESDYNVFIGAIFNLAHNFDQMLYLRPHNKFEEVENCYLVGGGTHPGSGLPTIYQSGIITADLINK